MDASKGSIDSTWSEMKAAWEDIQKQTFEVGLSSEESGDYETAIAYYKMVQTKN